MNDIGRALTPVAFAIAVMASAACDTQVAGPTAVDLTGTWTGTGSYPNAPFELRLIQTGNTLRGSYSDRLDTTTLVTGSRDAGAIMLSIDFGDAKLNVEGTIDDGRHVRGTMRTSALGNTPYPFAMTR